MARDYSRKPENVTTTDAVDENNHSFFSFFGLVGGGSGNESWSSAERKENQLAREDKRIRNGNTSNSNKPT